MSQIRRDLDHGIRSSDDWYHEEREEFPPSSDEAQSLCKQSLEDVELVQLVAAFDGRRASAKMTQEYVRVFREVVVHWSDVVPGDLVKCDSGGYAVVEEVRLTESTR